MGARKDDESGEWEADLREGADAGDEDADDPGDDSPRVTREELGAFLSRPEVLKRARGIVGKRVDSQDVGDLVNEAVASALGKEKMPRRASMQPWFDRVVRRRVADRYRKLQRRQAYEGDMPQAPAILDEGGEPVADPGDAVVDLDPSVDPTEPDFHAEGWLLRRWMRDAVAGDARDRETWALMEELADAGDDEKVTYKRLAARHGMTEAQLYKRIERLKSRYGERYEKWRNGVVVFLLLGAIALVALVALLSWILRPRDPDIGRDPNEFLPPRAAPSASATPTDTPFEPALPHSAQPAPSSAPAPRQPQPQGPPFK